jgi:2-amino-4-hydroxy-6-hydroxymethyldihydropteridine diphosphokinase
MDDGETACPPENEPRPTSAPALDAVIGLGANLGAPERQLRWAIGELARTSHLIGTSKLYRSAPVGGPPQPDFRNAAVRIHFQGSARELLEALLGIERVAGRERRERWGPRVLDLDILWVAGMWVSEEDLVIPHPRLRERAFALCPLLDVAPDALDPRDGASFAKLLSELGPSGVEVVGWS